MVGHKRGPCKVERPSSLHPGSCKPGVVVSLARREEFRGNTEGTRPIVLLVYMEVSTCLTCTRLEKSLKGMVGLNRTCTHPWYFDEETTIGV